MIDSVDRIKTPALMELRERYLARGVPVILTDHVATWPASEKWTPQYLSDTVGDKMVPVVTMVDGDYARSYRKDTLLSEYLEIAEAQEREIAESKKLPEHAEMRYLAQVSIAKAFPELLEDIKVPPFFPDEKYQAAVMYAGGTLFSQLHYHPRGSAVLCMVYGQKKVRLFPPDQGRYLYPHSVRSGLSHVSQTTHKHPDATLYPEFEKAHYVEVTLNAGEALFIPIYWWHSIENIGFSISSVFFWSTSWASKFLPPPGPRASYLYQPVASAASFSKRVVSKVKRTLKPA
ncbi:MAG: cupin-like domain-containing protein [Gammaproteobacteria bacterium]